MNKDHEHIYSLDSVNDEFVCKCGHRVTGLELFESGWMRKYWIESRGLQ